MFVPPPIACQDIAQGNLVQEVSTLTAVIVFVSERLCTI